MFIKYLTNILPPINLLKQKDFEKRAPLCQKKKKKH